MVASTYLACVLALVVITPAAQAAEPRPIAVVPAMSAVQAGRSLALWAPDLRSVLGYDASGKRLWRLATGDQGGQRDLDVLGANVLVYAGTEAILIAPETGKVRGRRADVVLGTPGGKRGCRIREHEGACALACECSFEVIACDTLATLGEPARLPRFEESDADGTPHSRCPMFSGAVLGRSGDALITSFPAATDKPFFSVPEITIARHARTGAELWRSSEIGFFDEELSGVASDGTCYAGSRAGSLTVFDCQRKTVLWKRPITAVPGGELQVEAKPHGIVVRDGTRVALLDTRSGRPSWQVEVPTTSIVLLGELTPPYGGVVIDRRFGKAIKGARLLKVNDGTTLGEITFGNETDRWPRRFGVGVEGWIVLAGKRIEAYDAAGKSLGGLGSSASFSDYVIGSGPNIAAWDNNAIALATLPATKALSPGSAILAKAQDILNGSGLRVVAYEGALGPGHLAVMVDGQGPWDPKKPDSFGELRVYRLGP